MFLPSQVGSVSSETWLSPPTEQADQGKYRRQHIRQKSEVYHLLDPGFTNQGGLKTQGPILFSNNRAAGETTGVLQSKAHFETVLAV